MEISLCNHCGLDRDTAMRHIVGKIKLFPAAALGCTPQKWSECIVPLRFACEKRMSGCLLGRVAPRAVWPGRIFRLVPSK
jgi:hypothetical protein